MAVTLVVFLTALLTHFGACATDPAFVPTSFTAHRRLTAQVLVGDSAHAYSLEVDMQDSSGITIGLDATDYANVVDHPRALSRSYDVVNKQDKVILDNHVYILPVRYVRKSELNTTDADVDGVLGLGRQMPIWRYWRTHSLGTGGMWFGKPSRIFKKMRHAQIPLIECLLCTTGICTFLGEVDGKEYAVSLLERDTNLYLPQDLYDKYKDGQPMYREHEFPLQDIRIKLHRNLTHAQCIRAFHEAGFDGVSSCDQDFEFRITPSMYTTRRIGRDSTLINTLKLNTNAQVMGKEHILLPNTIMSQVITYNELHNRHILVAKPHRVYLTQDTASIILLVVLAYVYVKYRAPHSSRRYEFEITTSGVRITDRTFWLMLTEATGFIATAILLYLTPQTWRIIDDFPEVAWTIYVLVTYYLLVGSFIMYYAVVQPGDSGDIVVAHGVHTLRRFAVEFVLLAGIWLTWVHMRLTELGTAPTTAISVYLVYSLGSIVARRAVFMYHMDTRGVRWNAVSAPSALGDSLDLGALGLLSIGNFAALGLVVVFAADYNAHPWFDHIFRTFTSSTGYIAWSLVITVLLLSWLFVAYDYVMGRSFEEPYKEKDDEIKQS